MLLKVETMEGCLGSHCTVFREQKAVIANSPLLFSHHACCAKLQLHPFTNLFWNVVLWQFILRIGRLNSRLLWFSYGKEKCWKRQNYLIDWDDSHVVAQVPLIWTIQNHISQTVNRDEGPFYLCHTYEMSTGCSQSMPTQEHKRQRSCRRNLPADFQIFFFFLLIKCTKL